MLCRFHSTAGLIELVLALVTGPMYLMFASLVPWWTIVLQVSLQSVPYATYFAMRAWREGNRNGSPAGSGWLPEASVGAIILMFIVFVALASAGAYSFESSKRKAFANHLNFRLAVGEALRARALADRGRYKLIQSTAEDTAFLSAFGYIGHEIRNPLHQLSGVLWYFKDSLRVVKAKMVHSRTSNGTDPCTAASAAAADDAGNLNGAELADEQTCLLLPTEAAVELKTALRCSEAMQSILSDMLDLGALRTATMTIRDQPTDVCDIARDVIASHLGAAIDVKMRLVRNFRAPRKLMLDPHRFRQILVNAIEHALRVTAAKATLSGRTVSIHMLETEALMPVSASARDQAAAIEAEIRDPGLAAIDSAARLPPWSDNSEGGSAVLPEVIDHAAEARHQRAHTSTHTPADMALMPVLRIMVFDEGATLAAGEELRLFDEFQAAAARKSHLLRDSAHQPASTPLKGDSGTQSATSMLLPYTLPRAVERAGSLSDLAHALLSPVGSVPAAPVAVSSETARLATDAANGDATGLPHNQNAPIPRSRPAKVGVSLSKTITSHVSDRVTTSSTPLNSEAGSPIGVSAPATGLVRRVSRIFGTNRAARPSGDVAPSPLASSATSSLADASHARPPVLLTIDTTAPPPPPATALSSGADSRIQPHASNQRWRGRTSAAVTPAHADGLESAAGSGDESDPSVHRGFGSIANPTPSHIAIAISQPTHDHTTLPTADPEPASDAAARPAPSQDDDVVEEFMPPVRSAAAALTSDDTSTSPLPHHLGAGSGLGLAIVKRLATAMGGTAGIANRTDGVSGNVLHVDLPLKLAVSAKTQSAPCYGSKPTVVTGTRALHTSASSDSLGAKSTPMQLSLSPTVPQQLFTFSPTALSASTDVHSTSSSSSRAGTISRAQSHNPSAALASADSAPFSLARLSSRLAGISARMLHRGFSGGDRSASPGQDTATASDPHHPATKQLPTIRSAASLVGAVQVPALASSDRSSQGSSVSGSLEVSALVPGHGVPGPSAAAGGSERAVNVIRGPPSLSPASETSFRELSHDSSGAGRAAAPASDGVPPAATPHTLPQPSTTRHQQLHDASGPTAGLGRNAIDETASMLPLASTPKPADGKLRVLAVDDESANRRLISRFLSKAGIEVDLLTDGDEVLPHLRKCLTGTAGGGVSSDDADQSSTRRLGWPYNAILLDIRMPRMHGVRCLQELKRAGLSEDVPVLAVTGNIAEEDG